MFNKFKIQIRDWFFANSDKKISRFVLYLITFTESSFFPIPPDPFLALAVLIKPKKWLTLALNLTLWSVVGGVFGYFIGFWFFDFFGPRIIDFYNLSEDFLQIKTFFSQYGFLTVFIAAFTPIPYKIFTISAGLFSTNLIVFIVASIIGRGFRFLIVGWLFSYLGENYSEKIFKYFNLITLIVGLIVITLVIYKFI